MVQTGVVDPFELTERATEAAQAWTPGVEVSDVQPLTGGMSSLTFTARAGDEQIVLKVAPPDLPAVRNRDVLRQGRLLEALGPVPDVPVPTLLFDDPGSPPTVPPFIAMAFVPGECAEPVLEDRPPGRARTQVRGRAFDAAAALAALHRVDPVAVGLGDVERFSLGDEIDRWTRALDTVDPAVSRGYRRCATALHEAVPIERPLRVVHGDYRLGNTLCCGDRLTAIIDWELWGLGDPRTDLAWFLFFTDEGEHASAPTTIPSGMPTGDELLDAYRAAGGDPGESLAWFHALTRYKEAGATALIFKHMAKRGEPPAGDAEVLIPGWIDEAMALLARDGGGVPR